MTTQIPDLIALGGEEFDVAAVNGTGPFEPREHGLPPGLMLHTACIRGFLCGYAVENGQLLLRELELGWPDEPPALDGSPARPYRGAWRYENLAMPVRFTGRILAAARRLPEVPEVHAGFWPAWMYETVSELVFGDGKLRQAYDRSAELAATRARITAALAPGGNGPAAGEPAEEWIARAFTLGEFGYSWPR